MFQSAVGFVPCEELQVSKAAAMAMFLLRPKINGLPKYLCFLFHCLF